MNIKLVLVAAVVLLLYLAHCRFYPYTSCGACNAGKHHSASGENWRNCRRCEGTGKKIRLGRRLLGSTKDL